MKKPFGYKVKIGIYNPRKGSHSFKRDSPKMGVN